MNLEIKKELKMKEGLENLRRALGEKTADRKDIQQQIISSTTTIQGTESLKIFSSNESLKSLKLNH